MAPSRCLAASAAALLVLLASAPALSQGLNDLVCDHDGKPAQPKDLKVSSNKEAGDGQHAGEKPCAHC